MQVDPLVAHGGAEAADLADRLGAVLEPVAVLVDEELRALVAAGLLVGGEGQHDRALGHPTGRARGPGRTLSTIASKSFMSTAPRPQTQPSWISPENGSTCQSAASAGTTSRWPCTQQRLARSVAAPAGEQAGAARLGLVDLAARCRPRRAAPRRARRPCAPPARSPSPGVGGVDADEVAAEVDDLARRGRTTGCRSSRSSGHPRTPVDRSRCKESAGALLSLPPHSRPLPGVPDATRPGGGIGRRASLRC